MASVAIDALRGLVLSAAEVRSLTNWPSRMIEDYLTILENLVELAVIIDDLSDDTIFAIQRLAQLQAMDAIQLGKVRSMVNKNTARILINESDIDDIKMDIINLQTKDKKLEQMIVSWV